MEATPRRPPEGEGDEVGESEGCNIERASGGSGGGGGGGVGLVRAGPGRVGDVVVGVVMKEDSASLFVVSGSLIRLERVLVETVILSSCGVEGFVKVLSLFWLVAVSCLLLSEVLMFNIFFLQVYTVNELCNFLV